MKKLMLLFVVVLIVSCSSVSRLDRKLENNFAIEFSENSVGELRANYARNSSRWKSQIKGTIDNTLNLVGTPNEFGWVWETPEIEVKMDSRIIIIDYKQR